MNQQQQRLVLIIQKIEIFKNLSLDDVRQILQVCKMRHFSPNELVYKAGDASDEMLVLLKGQMMITSASGEPLGSVTAGNPIGEMGVFTGQARSASVTATTDAGGLAIRKMDVEIMLSRNPMMYVKVLKNIVHVLCMRLGQTNTQNEQHMKTIMRMRDLMDDREGETSDEDEGASEDSK